MPLPARPAQPVQASAAYLLPGIFLPDLPELRVQLVLSPVRAARHRPGPGRSWMLVVAEYGVGGQLTDQSVGAVPRFEDRVLDLVVVCGGATACRSIR